MQAFTDFQLQVMYPPNPIRALDDSLNADQQAGADFFFNRDTFALFEGATVFKCATCHVTDPDANAEFGVERPGFFGTDGQVVGGEFSQTLKVPHLRNLYTKVGTFGFGDGDFFFNNPALPFYDPSHRGDQIRAFGFTHDGSKDVPMRFFNAFVATPFTPELGLSYGGGVFTTSFSALPPLTDAQVRLLAAARPVTYTCTPPGSGHRLGVDRDGDGHRDGDELLAGSDPADPNDTP